MYSCSLSYQRVMLLFLCMVFSSCAMANIVITGTRVIYNSGDKETTVKVNNRGKGPVLLQSWIDTGDANATPDKIQVPFIISPPINRVDAGKGQTLRITHTGSVTLPADRESVFWLNVLEIPPSGMKNNDTNSLQIAFRTRIKMFYRPATLKDNSANAAETLKWEIRNGELTAINNSPYHVNLLSVYTDRRTVAEGSGDMVKPFGRLAIKNNRGKFTHGQEITWQYINDWGAVKEASVKLN